MDLVALQENTGQIRNPFGFDFICSWDKRPIVLAGDNKWKTVIEPLRSHIARHLYMKIRYQYHDEQVEKLRLAGQEKSARRYMVPAQVENKIWMMITGEPLPTKGKANDEQVEKADLSELEGQLSKLDKVARGNNQVANVSAILERANAEALSDHGTLGAGESAHKRGGSDINGQDVPKKKVDKTPISADELSVPAVDPIQETPVADNTAFSGLSELDNES